MNILYLHKKSKMSNILNRYLFFFKELGIRLDYILYKSCFVINIKQSKQLIKHGHIKVNNSIITNPTYKKNKYI